MWETETVEAGKAEVGTEFYSAKKNAAPCHWWHRIQAVRPIDEKTVELTCAGFYTRKHPREAITVRRWVKSAE